MFVVRKKNYSKTNNQPQKQQIKIYSVLRFLGRVPRVLLKKNKETSYENCKHYEFCASDRRAYGG